MSTRDNALRFTLRKTVADLVADEVKAERADRLAELLELHEDTGADRIAVRIPGGDVVATLTLAKPSTRESVDADKLTAWARENAPEVLETVHHEAVPAYDEERVNMDRLRELGLQVTPDGTVLTTEGVPVDGLTVRTPPPSSFAVRYAPGGREALVESWRAGELAHLSMGATLPSLEALDRDEGPQP